MTTARTAICKAILESVDMLAMVLHYQGKYEQAEAMN